MEWVRKQDEERVLGRSWGCRSGVQNAWASSPRSGGSPGAPRRGALRGDALPASAPVCGDFQDRLRGGFPVAFPLVRASGPPAVACRFLLPVRGPPSGLFRGGQL